MAYLVFSTKGQELGRRPVERRAVVGRSPECDISVRDILLSRRHCQFEQTPTGWQVTDLGSKNGTFVAGQVVATRTIGGGETVEIGQTKVTFHVGVLPGQEPVDRRQPVGSRRPADPWEALSGTVSGFEYNKTKGRIDVQRVGRKTVRPLSMFPKPQPTPADPHSYAREDIQTLLTEIASSSWDSIYANASRRVIRRPLPRPVVQTHRINPVSTPQREALQETTQKLLRHADRRIRRARWTGALTRMLKGVATVGQWVLILSPALCKA